MKHRWSKPQWYGWVLFVLVLVPLVASAGNTYYV